MMIMMMMRQKERKRIRVGNFKSQEENTEKEKIAKTEISIAGIGLRNSNFSGILLGVFGALDHFVRSAHVAVNHCAILPFSQAQIKTEK